VRDSCHFITCVSAEAGGAAAKFTSVRLLGTNVSSKFSTIANALTENAGLACHGCLTGALAGAKARSSELKPRIENMKNLFHRFIADQSGVAAIEYGLIAGLIAVVIISAVTLLGTNVASKFSTIANALT
jgi:pilus assembly protein Flp/PilA